MNIPITVQNELLARHAQHSQAGVFRDLTRPRGKSFPELVQNLQSCRTQGGGLNQSRLREVLNAAIADSDFGETYDMDISVEGFWDKIVALQQGLANVRILPTSSHSINSQELTLGSNGEDILRPGVEGTDPTTTVTSDTATRNFVPEEAIAQFGITDHVLEDQIEHGTLESHLMRMVQDAFGNGIAAAVWNGTKVGTTNSQRGSITGMFDGFIQQINGGGNIVYATAVGGGDRYVSSIQEEDAFLAAAKLLPTKYGNSGFNWITARGILHDWNAELAGRQTILGDAKIQAGYWAGLSAQGYPLFHNPSLRTDYIVKGTGTVQASSPVDTDLNGIAKSRQADVTVTSATNEANANKYVIDCDAAGTSFNLNAEKCTQSGAAVGNVITMAASLTRDHADAEIFTEYSTFPDADGVPCVLSDWNNFAVYYQRQLRVEVYRLPTTRTTYFILTVRLVPVVVNPDAAVLIRDLKVR